MTSELVLRVSAELTRELVAISYEITWLHVAGLLTLVIGGVALAIRATRSLSRGDGMLSKEYSPALHRETWLSIR
ncbi:hypothetical protein [Microbacterium sp. TPD7012]|uniref:hypothetical protein n=1 Tax=Microbacterium sp. TPD7012 TaxID=2171975 RepID=UPI000D5217F9|nr:hypothetical protein [Microbacterium sp. TPD7012]PVE94214.1 hypothetical protein DC434_15855 [Microbacterium sp. TPD7012]